jgi:N-acetylglutamate synthase-like GNAT family acetyltransferase
MPQITFTLDDHYSIKATTTENGTQVILMFDDKPVGHATLVTDGVDVGFVAALQIDNEHIALGDAFIKFLDKFPFTARKLEFRFMLEIPENLKPIISKHHFDQGRGTETEEKILLRCEKKLPIPFTPAAGITFKQEINADHVPTLLSLLQKDTYWQNHLTLERLQLLLKNAKCFYVFRGEELVAFTRVVTDNTSFASLWDVVVAAHHRKQGIATSLMHHVFTNPNLSQIPTWVLFTDTAKSLYEKFGFAPPSNRCAMPTPF